MTEQAPLDAALHRALFQVTDRLRKLKNNPREVTLGEYNDILRELCGALTTSLEHGLDKAVFSRIANDPELQTEARLITGDLKAFAAFLQFEHKVLVRCGVSPETAKDIVAQIKPLKDQLREFKYDPEKVMSIVRHLQVASCKGVRLAGDYLDREEELFEAKKRALITYGSATIAANGSAVAITFGAAAPFATLSAAAGGLLITWRGILEAPRDRKPGKH